jgi:hypothetical protein
MYVPARPTSPVKVISELEVLSRVYLGASKAMPKSTTKFQFDPESSSKSTSGVKLPPLVDPLFKFRSRLLTDSSQSLKVPDSE